MNREHLKAWIERFSSKISFGILGNVCIGILFCRPNFCPVKRAWQACSQSNLIVQSRSSSGQGSYWKIQFTKPKRQTYTEFNSQISDARNKSREQKKKRSADLNRCDCIKKPQKPQSALFQHSNSIWIVIVFLILSKHHHYPLGVVGAHCTSPKWVLQYVYVARNAFKLVLVCVCVWSWTVEYLCVIMLTKNHIKSHFENSILRLEMFAFCVVIWCLVAHPQLQS